MGYVKLLEKDIKEELKKEKYVPLLENRKLIYDSFVKIIHMLDEDNFIYNTQPADTLAIISQNRFDVFDALKNARRYELLTDFAIFMNAWDFLDTQALPDMKKKAEKIYKYSHISFKELDAIARDYYLGETLLNVLKELMV